MPRKCRLCSADTPRSHRIYCNYCDNRFSADVLTLGDRSFGRAIRSLEARERMAAMDRATRPRVTRDSVELAKPHPWECDEYAP